MLPISLHYLAQVTRTGRGVAFPPLECSKQKHNMIFLYI
jgi:hypothetical protein